MRKRFFDWEAYLIHPALSMLLKRPKTTVETEYIVQVDNNGESYEIEVDEETYNNIKIGDIKECEFETQTNQYTQEYGYKIYFVEE